MNNFPFNNVNLLQNLAMIRANLIAQNGLGANPLLNPAPQNTFIPMNQPFVPFQPNQGETQTPQNPLQQSFLNHLFALQKVLITMSEECQRVQDRKSVV